MEIERTKPTTCLSSSIGKVEETQSEISNGESSISENSYPTNCCLQLLEGQFTQLGHSGRLLTS